MVECFPSKYEAPGSIPSTQILVPPPLKTKKNHNIKNFWKPSRFPIIQRRSHFYLLLTNINQYTEDTNAKISENFPQLSSKWNSMSDQLPHLVFPLSCCPFWPVSKSFLASVSANCASHWFASICGTCVVDLSQVYCLTSQDIQPPLRGSLWRCCLGQSSAIFWSSWGS